MTAPRHEPYWNQILDEEFCHADGEPYPCLHVRQTRPPKCLCSHPKHNNQCWSTACGCTSYRPTVAGRDLDPDKEIPARWDDRYDPSPEPIDRKTR